MKPKKKMTKRRYLINKKFQLGNALLIIGLQIPCTLLTGLVLSGFFLFIVDSRMVSSFNTGLLSNMIFSLLVVSAGVAWLSIRFTHKIVGPIEKTSALLRDIARGKLPENRISFRKNDRFRELSKDLNGIVTVMKKQKKTLEDISRELTALKKAMTEKNPENPDIVKIDAVLEKMSVN